MGESLSKLFSGTKDETWVNTGEKPEKDPDFGVLVSQTKQQVGRLTPPMRADFVESEAVRYGRHPTLRAIGGGHKKRKKRTYKRKKTKKRSMKRSKKKRSKKR
jgi:hypothetical protein